MSCGVILILGLLGLGAAPATAPSDLIRTWFNQLADSDPDVREQARVNLMGIDRRELPALRQIVTESRPIRASQAAVLYDIVTHAYAAGEPYIAQEKGCVLGVQLSPSQDPPGVEVAQRFPGFCAYRFLRDGDVIIGIAEMPGALSKVPLDLRAILGQVPGGTRLTFQVLRNGQTRSIPIRLDACPANPAADLETAIRKLHELREQRAVEFWTRNFAPLLEDQGVTAAGR